MGYLYKKLVRTVGILKGITVRSVDEMHDLCVNFTQALFHHTGAMHTTWMISCSTADGVLALESRWDGDHEKDEVAAFIRQYLKGINADIYAHIDEAWATEQPANVDISKVPRPSEDPNRQEILIIDTFSKTEWRSTAFQIERNPDPVLTNRRDAPQSTVMSGRLWNLLEEHTIQ